MGNKLLKVAFYAAFLFFILTNVSYGQNISKYYSSTYQDNGILYFIYPQKGFKTPKSNNEFNYDITFLTSNEYSILNFSYYDKLYRNFDSIVFKNASHEFSVSPEQIFIETKKKKWHYRYTTHFLLTDLNDFFNPEHLPKITLYSKQGIVELSVNRKKWKKNAVIIKKIFLLINLNFTQNTR